VKHLMTNDGPAPHRPPGPAESRAPSTETPLRKVWHNTRNRLLEGLLVLLPILVTFWILWWLYSAVANYVLTPLAKFVIFKTGLILSAPELPYWFETYVAPVLGGLLALAIVYCCGTLAHSRLRRALDNALLRVPVVSYIYDGVRNVFQGFNRPAGQQTPQRIVLVPFPHPGMRLPAIVTAVSRDVSTDRTVLCVYVPTTPIPTSGFFLMIPEEEVTELNWDVQQTLQAIISGGLTAPKQVTYYKPASPVPPGARVGPQPFAPPEDAGKA
jgi:uncharacterized membrane protein